jgi:hypothetical protein
MTVRTKCTGTADILAVHSDTIFQSGQVRRAWSGSDEGEAQEWWDEARSRCKRLRSRYGEW